MSKKKKSVIIALILLAIVVSFIGGKTFSKYVTEVIGNGTAEVASWEFKVNGTEDAEQTINLTSTCNNETLVNNKIAPGTSGSFDIVIDCTGSDVGIEYDIDIFNKNQRPGNLIFSYDGDKYGDLRDIAKVLSGGIINANDENKVRTFTIDWEWPYETGTTEEQKAMNDQIDTNNGKYMENYQFKVIISGTQILPQE